MSLLLKVWFPKKWHLSQRSNKICTGAFKNLENVLPNN